jgi:hypothetical protein
MRQSKYTRCRITGCTAPYWRFGWCRPHRSAYWIKWQRDRKQAERDRKEAARLEMARLLGLEPREPRKFDRWRMMRQTPA